MRMESPLNQRLRRSPPDVVYTPIDVTSEWGRRRSDSGTKSTPASPDDSRYEVLKHVTHAQPAIRNATDAPPSITTECPERPAACSRGGATRPSQRAHLPASERLQGVRTGWDPSFAAVSIDVHWLRCDTLHVPLTVHLTVLPRNDMLVSERPVALLCYDTGWPCLETFEIDCLGTLGRARETLAPTVGCRLVFRTGGKRAKVRLRVSDLPPPV